MIDFQGRSLSFAEIREQLDAIEQRLAKMTRELVHARPDFSLLAHQAEWHVRALAYHGRSLCQHYEEIANGVSVRATALPDRKPNVIIMHAPTFQMLLADFYALVNLARITLDNMRMFLRPVFATNFNQLPKSVSDFIDNSTDCPVYNHLASNPQVGYLCDIRNCIVHFRTFATNDSAIVAEEGMDVQEMGLDDNPWTIPMARARFRWVSDSILAVNFVLPDTIFERTASGDKKLARFTYDKGNNILGISLHFVDLVATSIVESFDLLLKVDKPTFTFERRRTR